MQYKKYKKEFGYSYTLGPFPTFELINCAPEKALAVYALPSFTELEKLESLCAKKEIPFIIGENQIKKIAEKEACYAVGIFKKPHSSLDSAANHVLLYNPSDMGNLGTILRTLLGFGIKNLGIITPCADVYSPKVVRASMGAIFSMRVQHFNNFEDYSSAYGKGRDMFPFMLSGKNQLSIENCPKSSRYTLIFGNEARGLPKEFENKGIPIFIPQSPQVDSLNLGVSVAIGAFVFGNKNKLPPLK